LIQQTNSADFDSAIPRFESWRPSQQKRNFYSYFEFGSFLVIPKFIRRVIPKFCSL
jgi:hypothetical protein